MLSRRVHTVAVVALVFGVTTAARAQTLTFPPYPANAATLGPIPDSAGPGCGVPGTPRDVTFATPLAAGLATVSLSVVLAHPSAGHLSATLIAPDGTPHVVFGRPGAVAAGDCGSSGDLSGQYGFDDTGAGFWTAAATSGTVPTATYRTSTAGGAPGGGANTLFAATFAGKNAGGTWTLRLVDWGSGDAGTVQAAALSVTYPRVVPTAQDSYAIGANTPLVVPAPGVLGNDSPAHAPLAVADFLFRPVAHGTLTLASDGGFSYIPNAGFVGQDLFAYYALSAAGISDATAVTIDVLPAAPPTDIEVVSIAGRRVVLRWSAGSGAAATSYELRWGLAPGVPLGVVTLPRLPTAVAVDVAPGVYYVSLRALSAVGASAYSPEIAINTGLAALPSAPSTPVVGVSGSALTLLWKTTFLGGVPAGARVEVSGAFALTVPVASGEALQVTGVPPGVYTLAVRSLNASGVSAPSPPVTVTVPGTCVAPQTPVRFVAFSSAGRLGAAWDPAASGGAPDRYEVAVSNAVAATLPVGLQRVHEVPAPPGVYGLQVRAVNACGASAFTAVQSAVVP